jgi:hypothetical protein
VSLSLSSHLSQIMSVTIITNLLSSLFQDAKLGRFVENIDGSYARYHDPAAAQAPMATVREFEYGGCNWETFKNSFKNSFGFSLTSPPSAVRSNRSGTQVLIGPGLCRVRALDNSDNWFDDAISGEDTRVWVERAAIREHKVFVVVGFCTLVDTQLPQKSIKEQESQGHNMALSSSSLTTAHAALPNSDPIEQVFAIYREVKHDWLDSRTVEKSTSGNPRLWLCMDNLVCRYSQCGGDDDDDNEDMIQVRILEVGHIGNGWNATECETKCATEER